MDRRKRTPNSTYIRLRLSPLGQVYAFLGHDGVWGFVLFTLLVLDPWGDHGQGGVSEDAAALGTGLIALAATCALVLTVGLIGRAYHRDVQRAVLELIDNNGPMRRAKLLKACRPERLRPAVLLATETLLANGQLTHTRQGYCVSDDSRLPAETRQTVG